MPLQNCKNILIAPLDWGLGHTTRCIPIMQYLQQAGHSVVFAGNEWQRSFIKKTFPTIENIHLEGYNVAYSRSKTGFAFSILAQIPRLTSVIKEEHSWLQQQIATGKYDGIISDNRYGLYHSAIPSVIMTHQLHILSGMGKVADNMLQQIHYRFIERFNNCWVVDNEAPNNLAGILSHPSKKPEHTTYIGTLSQFEPTNYAKESDSLLILLSGPEPQRTILSEMLWQQVTKYKGPVIFVAGSDNVTMPADIPGNVIYHKRLTKEMLLPLLQQAGMVVCRSGYSTIMDLVQLNKKAILIPTPGQTEQEYLGKYLHGQGMFYSAPQKDFNLLYSLGHAAQFPYKNAKVKDAFDGYKKVLDKWLERL